MKTLLTLCLLLSLSLAKQVGPVKPTAAAATPVNKGPSFSVTTHPDSGMIGGRKVMIPVSLITWTNAKGDSLVWDSETGSVIAGDSTLFAKEHKAMINFLLNEIGQIRKEQQVRDSVASDVIGRAYQILNPRQGR